MKHLEEQAQAFLDFIKPVDPVAHFLNCLDQKHDAHWSNVVLTDMNERRIMDELGFDQDQLRPYE